MQIGDYIGAGTPIATLDDRTAILVEFTVPDAPGAEWQLAASSDPEQVVEGEVTTLIVRDASFTLLRSAAS